MIKKIKIPTMFRPTFERDYENFGTRINVQIEYWGPIPEVGKAYKPEVFVFAIYQRGELVDEGRLEWDSKNGPLTMSQAAKAIVIYWNTSLLHNS